MSNHREKPPVDPVEEQQSFDHSNRQSTQRSGRSPINSQMLKNVANAKDQVFMTTAQTRGANKLNEDYPQKEVIKGLHEDLMTHILDIEKYLDKMLQAHEKNFLVIYKAYMTDIMRELKTLKKKVDEETVKRKADERMTILSEERDWFRAEALRLDKICKEQDKILVEQKVQLNIMHNERLYYEEEIFEARKQNKLLQEQLFRYNSSVQDSKSIQNTERFEKLPSPMRKMQSNTFFDKNFVNKPLTSKIGGQRKHQLRELKISEISVLSKRDAEAQDHLQTSRAYY